MTLDPCAEYVQKIAGSCRRIFKGCTCGAILAAFLHILFVKAFAKAEAERTDRLLISEARVESNRGSFHLYFPVIKSPEVRRAEGEAGKEILVRSQRKP